MSYLNLGIRIDRLVAEGDPTLGSDRRCAAVVTEAPVGGLGRPSIFSLKDLEDAVRTRSLVEAGRNGVLGRSANGLVAAGAAQAGSEMFNVVFPFGSDIRRCVEMSLRATQTSPSTALRICLCVDDELSQYPWEWLCYEDEIGSALERLRIGGDRATSLVRSASGRACRPLEAVKPPLKILCVSANPLGGFGDVSNFVRAQRAEFEALVGGCGRSSPVIVDWLDGPNTLGRLNERVTKFQPHLVHVLSHGGSDESGKFLAFESIDGNVHRVRADRFATTLRGHRSIRLVVLNACKSASSSAAGFSEGSYVTGSFIARLTVGDGIPVAIGMHFEVSLPTVDTFNRSFYRSLLSGVAIEESVGRACRQILADSSEEWGAPVIAIGNFSEAALSLPVEFAREADETAFDETGAFDMGGNCDEGVPKTSALPGRPTLAKRMGGLSSVPPRPGALLISDGVLGEAIGLGLTPAQRRSLAEEFR